MLGSWVRAPCESLGKWKRITYTVILFLFDNQLIMRYFRVHPASKRLFFMVNLCVFSYRYLPIFTYLCTHSDTTCDTTFDIFLVIPKFKMMILSYPTSRFVFDRKNRSSDKRKGLVQLEIKHDRKRKWISRC